MFLRLAVIKNIILQLHVVWVDNKSLFFQKIEKFQPQVGLFALFFCKLYRKYNWRNNRKGKFNFQSDYENT